jgi:hypothetical protein
MLTITRIGGSLLTAAGGAKGFRWIQPPRTRERPNISGRTRGKVSEPTSKPKFVRHAQTNFSENTPTPQFKLDIRNEPIQEEDGDAYEAIAHVANTLRLVSLAAREPLRRTLNFPSKQHPIGKELSVVEETLGTQSLCPHHNLRRLPPQIPLHLPPLSNKPGLQHSLQRTTLARTRNRSALPAPLAASLALPQNTLISTNRASTHL